MKNKILESKHGRRFLADVQVYADGAKKPAVIFCHGFKGFKDWGCFNQLGSAFGAAGFVFVKFNFSHNGTTVDAPMDFADLEAFGHNNFIIELDDLGVVLDWMHAPGFEYREEVDYSRIYLMGHSRGGGICLLKGYEDERVSKIATWGAVNEFGKFWSKGLMEIIKRDGVIYIPNARTNQKMPVYWQLYENYQENLDRLHIPTAVKQLEKPVLVVHGTSDETVLVSSATELGQWNPKVEVYLIQGANHNFGAKHPCMEEALHDDMQLAFEKTVSFFKD
jgi:pimeloyl-ACP methyl ester carboxylesterase